MTSRDFTIKAALVAAFVSSMLARVWLSSSVPWFASGWPEYLSYLLAAIPVLFLGYGLRRYGAPKP